MSISVYANRQYGSTAEQYYMPGYPINVYAAIIAPNPITSFNPYPHFPKVHPSSFIGPFSSIIGAVRISENVFIAPNVSIRADEGYPFHIGRNTNIQDGVILHGLRDKRIKADHNFYSIYIGDGVTCAHGCIIHGPCYVGDNCFIGFNSIVFNAVLEAGVYVSSAAVVTNGVTVLKGKFVPPGASIDSQEKADKLNNVPADQESFAEEVRRVNEEFPASYSLLFGSCRCSCGLCCNEKFPE